MRIKSGGSKVGKRYGQSVRNMAAISGSSLNDVTKARKSPRTAKHTAMIGGTRKARVTATSHTAYAGATLRRMTKRYGSKKMQELKSRGYRF